MSKMIPVEINDESVTKNKAVMKTFNCLKEMTWGDAIVLHSVLLKQSSLNEKCEIDFVVICDEGVMCVEVRGGVLEHKNDQWLYGDRVVKSEGPYNFMQKSMKLLQQYLEEHFSTDDPICNCHLACCLITPDCVIKAESGYTEVIPEITYNAEMESSDLPKVFERSFRYWQEERHFGGNGKLAKQDKERLATFLKG
ncbi:nuclease-related domain-containing protein [Anaerovibrio sp. RM50]|uniref:nuclease-related domain-containing protein n=1 Tax=Anaerovibrio sp. RM50 TaxID=1200557 RepID=UPI000480ED50|nr:nuclease-related domain-containing protein [Anaerovibrio sp. RM50]